MSSNDNVPAKQPPAAGIASRFFGGPPLSVIFRLILLSILVGVILKVLGLDPLNIIRSIRTCSAPSGTWASTPSSGCGAISSSALRS